MLVCSGRGESDRDLGACFCEEGPGKRRVREPERRKKGPPRAGEGGKSFKDRWSLVAVQGCEAEAG